MFFGTMIDKTKKVDLEKLQGDVYAQYLEACAVTLVANFLRFLQRVWDTAQYVWFFIAYTLLNAVKNTAFNNVYAIKNHTYCAVVPRLSGIAKFATSVTAQPIYAYNIHGLAFPSLLFVLSIIVPKNISLIPSNSFDTIISVPIIPGFKPTVFVMYWIISRRG